MEGRKEKNRETYLTKKFNSKKESNARSKNVEEDEFACFRTMAAEVLDSFLKNKYDTYSYKSSDYMLQLNRAIIDRLNKLRQEFLATQKKQFIDFVAKSGKTITNEQYQAIGNGQMGLFYPKFCRLIRTPQNGVGMCQVVIKENTNQREAQTFYISKLPESCSQDFDYKRLKKEADEFLQDFIKITSTLEEARKLN